ncbi:excisionase family protein [Photobacterium sanguinicancri]|uniref:excisionase family protein n=1 Tax=Photobacterium sanguinicancri TaxID=875932 RepID=UPI0026E38359|nr:excisionase family protein [Photobacterium sanguinicancri]MDO6498560.1 excisionase family protein [Photobacterium sanguinicancri]
MSSDISLVTPPPNKWVGSNYIVFMFGLTEDNLANYRRNWMQGKHYRKIGPSGQPSLKKAKILYNIPEINKWIESYPQHF